MTRHSMHLVTFSIIASLLIFTIAASATSETIVHAFSQMPNGGYPRVGLISDAAGNLYGTTPKGGSYGVVFRLSRNSHGQWTETVLHNFTGGNTGPDGSFPQSALTFDAAGNLYGTTSNGGSYGCGVAFKLSPVATGPWKETIIHSFACYPVDGTGPSGSLIFDAAGNLYGVTSLGGNVACGDGYTVYGCGVVYELSPSAAGYKETILYNFGNANFGEANPAGPLTFDASGNLYGTAQSGGNAACSFYGGCGTVFKLTKTTSGWTESTIYNLTGGADGDTPSSGVFFDEAGNLYGTGAGYYGYGGVFILSPDADGSWSETSPFTFTSSNSGFSGTNGNVVRDSAGNLYGAAEAGGNTTCTNNGCGGIYELTDSSTGWKETNLYSFTDGTDGAKPMATLLRDSAGNLYSTTYQGGKGAGSVFKLSPGSQGTWTESTLYDFPVFKEGTAPYAGLIPDGAGNYYGTTSTGGLNTSCLYWTGCGSVFKLTPNGSGGWTETVIYAFTGQNGDGIYPTGDLVLDSAGNLYGTTRTGGAVGSCPNYDDYCGTVFKLSPNGDGTWSESVIHAFTGYSSDGSNPFYGLVLDSAGNLYGTTTRGGTYDSGIAFELSPGSNGWTETILHVFGASGDAAGPSSTLVIDAKGNLYGTASSDSNGVGAVYRLSPSGSGWTESLLYVFTAGSNNSGGSSPQGNIVFDSAGNLYGAAIYGGSYGVGVVYKLTPTSSGSWTETLLYNFIGANGDGALPQGGVGFDSAGNLYGTTAYGGIYSGACTTTGCGTVFKLTPTSNGPWREQVLHRFSGGKDGSYPYANLVLDSAGNVFGTATASGTGNSGVIFEIKP